MKKLLTALILLLSFNVLAQDSCTHDEHNLRCVSYVRNYDADTVTFNIPKLHPLIGQKINIRVNGVDTPEIRTKNKCEKDKARHAKKLVAKLLKKAKRIDLQNIKRGKYFRVVADVIIDGKSLSDYLLKNGLAYSYDGGTKKKMNWCKSYREIASENK
ncbi:nuclease [Halobacteriovorax marinus]|uniref:Nuclease n=1 Tax=Halobacteriovorax marinus TaxID=97084 RepID=A0A1Y5F598_9BACT|nr:nuclease [Halobacteriovorax marinus]